MNFSCWSVSGKRNLVLKLLLKLTIRKKHGNYFALCCVAVPAQQEFMSLVQCKGNFWEVVVMATSCDACGYRNSELKPGGEIPAKGKKTTVRVKNVKDLSRDVIKTDSAAVSVPEHEFELSSGTLGGIMTTVEGLIVKICDIWRSELLSMLLAATE